MSLPILPIGTPEFILKSRYTKNDGKQGSIASNLSEFSINLENSMTTDKNTASDDSPIYADYRSEMCCTKYVNFDDLFRRDNVRGSLDLRIPEMVASLRKSGFKPNHPLVVSQQPDGTVLVLCGNRRVEGLEVIKAHDPAEFSRIVPGGKIPCIVYKGLTEEEEILIRVDHSDAEDRVGLGDWSQYLAIKQLLRAWPNKSETAIAEKLGLLVTKKGKNFGLPNRSLVQDRVSLARMPIFVEAQFKLLWEEGTAATAVRVTHIKKLIKAFRHDYANYPDGDSPAFLAVWDEIVNPPAPAEGDDSSGEIGPTDLKASDAEKRSHACNSGTVKRILLAVTNQGKHSLVELDATVSRLETDSAILDDIRHYLGNDDFASLVNDSRDARLAAEVAEVAESAEVA